MMSQVPAADPADVPGHSPVELRCAELEAQVTSLRAAVAVRTSIIDSQSGRIAELEAALESERELVRSLHDRLGKAEKTVEELTVRAHTHPTGRAR